MTDPVRPCILLAGPGWRIIHVSISGNGGNKTAKALGLDVPPTLLARADEVIE